MRFLTEEIISRFAKTGAELCRLNLISGAAGNM
jgi:hypothetical protein